MVEQNNNKTFCLSCASSWHCDAADAIIRLALNYSWWSMAITFWLQNKHDFKSCFCVCLETGLLMNRQSEIHDTPSTLVKSWTSKVFTRWVVISLFTNIVGFTLYSYHLNRTIGIMYWPLRSLFFYWIKLSLTVIPLSTFLWDLYYDSCTESQ